MASIVSRAGAHLTPSEGHHGQGAVQVDMHALQSVSLGAQGDRGGIEACLRGPQQGQLLQLDGGWLLLRAAGMDELHK